MDVIVTGRRCVIYAGDSYFNGDVIADIKEKEAARLLEKGHVRMTVDDAVIAKTPPVEDMRVSELKDLLDKLEVDYPSDARKQDLVDLVKTHTAEPPEE